MIKIDESEGGVFADITSIAISYFAPLPNSLEDLRSSFPKACLATHILLLRVANA
jgi:hypothetical protein